LSSLLDAPWVLDFLLPMLWYLLSYTLDKTAT